MSTYGLLFIVLLKIVQTTTIESSINLPECNSSAVDENNETEIEEKLKHLRIEMVKYQILSKLNFKEAPPTVQKNSEVQNEIIALLMKEEEEWQQKRDRLLNSEERLVVHAKRCNMQCVSSNKKYCKMCHFELKQSLSASSVDLWIYKWSKSHKKVSIVLPAFINGTTDKTFCYKAEGSGWNKLELPEMFPSPLRKENNYTIEIIGESIEHSGELRPFLLVSKLAFMPTRQRREVGCDTNESCCWKPFRVSFAEIGFNWVVYPSELEANLCAGRCTKDPSSVSSHYEIAMLKIVENDNTLKESLGECWSLCCKPKELEPVRVFYNDTDGIIHDQYIPDLSVKSCGCS